MRLAPDGFRWWAKLRRRHRGSTGRRRRAVAASVRRTLWASSGTSALSASLIVVGLMAASWAVSWLVGGAGVVVPHWYYFPVLVAALRFGHAGALVVAVGSGVLAGPLTPEVVGAGAAQSTSEWLTRTGFFVAVGQLAALLVQPGRPSLTGELQRWRAERAVRRALARDELAVWFQPVLTATDGRIVGAEALVRWHHPEQGVLSPGVFLPLVEQTSAIHDLGDWVLRRACAEAARWPDADMWVAVNLSAAELDAPGLCDRIAGATQAAGLAASRLCVEVTESTLVADFEGSAERLANLERLGVRIAIDDFGTGYSSLAYVHRFPAHILKIDRSFVARLEDEAQGGAVLGGVVLLARTLGMLTAAEGVETARQSQQVGELGCDLSQGYYHRRPMPAEQLAALLDAGQPAAGEARSERRR